jgi:predicted small lipoprotein YifL
MLPPRLSLAPALVAAGLLLVTLSACGRRGPLESPSATAQTPSGNNAVVAAPIGTARPKATDEPSRPRRPFVLDPLL